MNIVIAPNSTGSGHNMRALSLATELLKQKPTAKITVLLASLQNIFTPLFNKIGVDVIDMSDSLVDHSIKGHLEKNLNWESYVSKYIAVSFINSDYLLTYISIYRKINPDFIISDYNVSASMAAIISNVPHGLITERYDFTINQIDDETLELAGFNVDYEDLHNARIALHTVFQWIADTAVIILVDKPYIPKLDDGTAIANAMNLGNVHFTGPMIRSLDNSRKENIRKELGIGDGPLIVGSVGGTSMFIENKKDIINTYIKAFQLLKKEYSNLQFVLIGREKVQAPSDVIVLSYVPEWMPLLSQANLLLSSPGWITVTEISALKIPTVFVLSNLNEYHEIEASRRLSMLGFTSLVAPDAQELAEIIKPFIIENNELKNQIPYHLIAPHGSGITSAVQKLIIEIDRTSKNGINNPRILFNSVITDLLLKNNSSTTIFLETLLNCKLKISVRSEEEVPSNEINDQAKQVIGFDEHDTIIKRISVLLNPEGDIISENIVVYKKTNNPVRKLINNSTDPLGQQLISSKVKQFREIISSGISKWDTHLDCAYKEYSIHCESNFSIYLIEKFNPKYINPF